MEPKAWSVRQGRHPGWDPHTFTSYRLFLFIELLSASFRYWYPSSRYWLIHQTIPDILSANQADLRCNSTHWHDKLSCCCCCCFIYLIHQTIPDIPSVTMPCKLTSGVTQHALQQFVRMSCVVSVKITQLWRNTTEDQIKYQSGVSGENRTWHEHPVFGWCVTLCLNWMWKRFALKHWNKSQSL